MYLVWNLLICASFLQHQLWYRIVINRVFYDIMEHQTFVT